MLAGAWPARQVNGKLGARVGGLLAGRGRARLEPALWQQLPCSTAATLPTHTPKADTLLNHCKGAPQVTVSI